VVVFAISGLLDADAPTPLFSLSVADLDADTDELYALYTAWQRARCSLLDATPTS